MGDLHDRKIEEWYEELNFLINEYSGEVFWDEVYTEQDYFEGQHLPYELPDRKMKGKQVGEFDILAVSHDPQVILYGEVKKESSGRSYADEQIERAESFWEPRGWDVVGQVELVPGWDENYYNRERDFDLAEVEEAETKYDTERDWQPVDGFVTEIERELKDELQG